MKVIKNEDLKKIKGGSPSGGDILTPEKGSFQKVWSDIKHIFK